MNVAAQKGVRRMTVDIEIELFERARELLGTRGYRDTINQALREVDRAGVSAPGVMQAES